MMNLDDIQVGSKLDQIDESNYELDYELDYESNYELDYELDYESNYELKV